MWNDSNGSLAREAFRLLFHQFFLGTFQLEQEPENVSAVFVGKIHELNTNERRFDPSDDRFDVTYFLLWQYKTCRAQRTPDEPMLQKIFRYFAEETGAPAAELNNRKTD